MKTEQEIREHLQRIEHTRKDAEKKYIWEIVRPLKGKEEALKWVLEITD